MNVFPLQIQCEMSEMELFFYVENKNGYVRSPSGFVVVSITILSCTISKRWALRKICGLRITFSL